MKVDFDMQFKQLNGTPIQVSLEDTSPITLRTVASNAILFKEDNEKLTGEDQVKRLDLAMAIYAAKEPLELTAEQVSLIKAQVVKMYTTIIVGQAWKMLEGQL